MRTIQSLIVVGLTAALAEAVSASQTLPKPPVAPAATHAPARRAAAASHVAFKPVGTIQDIMAAMIDPASKVVFGAVGSDIVNGVETQKAPKDDAEWTAVRRSALMMVEGANLIVMDGRHVARPGQKPGVGELPHAEIEVRINKERAAWNTLAMEFSAAARLALTAAEKKDPDALFAVGADVDAGCENCHLRFWYPDQEKLFAK
jgi:hypothetical protein